VSVAFYSQSELTSQRFEIFLVQCANFPLLRSSVALGNLKGNVQPMARFSQLAKLAVVTGQVEWHGGFGREIVRHFQEQLQCLLRASKMSSTRYCTSLFSKQ
jgi:hypothetical protein